MNTNTKPTQYNVPMKILHWLSAGLFLFTIFLGIILTHTEMLKINEGSWIMIHKSMGTLSFLLVLIRIIVRSNSVLPESTNKKEKIYLALEHGVHYGLYIMLILIPLSGYIMSSYSHYGDSYSYFGLFNIPYIFAKNEELAKNWYFIHKIIAYTALGFVGVHIAAAIRHTLNEGLRFMRRMI